MSEFSAKQPDPNELAGELQKQFRVDVLGIPGPERGVARVATLADAKAARIYEACTERTAPMRKCLTYLAAVVLLGGRGTLAGLADIAGCDILPRIAPGRAIDCLRAAKAVAREALDAVEQVIDSSADGVMTERERIACERIITKAIDALYALRASVRGAHESSKSTNLKGGGSDETRTRNRAAQVKKSGKRPVNGNLGSARPARGKSSTRKGARR